MQTGADVQPSTFYLVQKLVGPEKFLPRENYVFVPCAYKVQSNGFNYI